MSVRQPTPPNEHQLGGLRIRIKEDYANKAFTRYHNISGIIRLTYVAHHCLMHAYLISDKYFG